MVRERWDSSGAFKKNDLFFKRLYELGSLFGYFLEENKSILVVREKDVEKAEKIMGTMIVISK